MVVVSSMGRFWGWGFIIIGLGNRKKTDMIESPWAFLVNSFEKGVLGIVKKSGDDPWSCAFNKGLKNCFDYVY